MANFISQWDTRNTSAGSTASDTIRLPFKNGGAFAYNCNIDWGDGNNNNFLTYQDESYYTHTYATEGIYTITISGTQCKGWNFNSQPDELKILDISQWGLLDFVQVLHKGLLIALI